MIKELNTAMRKSLKLDDLSRYNALRDQLKLAPLPEWTGTPAELTEAIAQLQATIDKPAKGKSPEKSKKDPPAADTFTIADLARELERDPKVVRAKLRGKDLPAFAAGRKWTWPNADRDAVRALITGTAPKMKDEGEANF